MKKWYTVYFQVINYVGDVIDEQAVAKFTTEKAAIWFAWNYYTDDSELFKVVVR